MGPLVDRWQDVLHEFLGPLRPPRYPLLMARFGLRALPPAALLARTLFRQEPARALFGGLAAHSIMPLEKPATAAFGLMLGMLAHAVGWPVARGGSQTVADTLAGYFRRLGGEIEAGRMVTSLDELPTARATLLDITPRQFVALAGERLPPGYRSRLHRYRYGPGVFKLDWALDGPIPWTAEACRQAGTVHLGPTLTAMAASEKAMWNGRHAAAPYVILVQPTVCDPSRAPAGKHVGWAYCHVPHGSTVDMTAAIEAQVERFAPGFRERILARHAMNTREYEVYNPNYVGGDINGGIQDLRQLFTRPVARWNPYTTPLDNVLLCSSSTPPGGGAHGMSGMFAAQTALRRM
jgi:phytoene dehydrogenase-like protein